MSTVPDRADLAATRFRKLQDDIVAALERADGSSFREDR